MNREEFEKAQAYAKEQAELYDGDEDGEEGGERFIGKTEEAWAFNDRGELINLVDGKKYGGEPCIDDSDPSTASAFANLELSPRQRQLAGERTRDELGRFVGTQEPEVDTEPLLREACESCGTHANMRMVNPTGAAWNTESGQSYIAHRCNCGCELLTEADGIPDEIQQKALDEAEVMAEILANHMERPIRD